MEIECDVSAEMCAEEAKSTARATLEMKMRESERGKKERKTFK